MPNSFDKDEQPQEKIKLSQEAYDDDHREVPLSGATATSVANGNADGTAAVGEKRSSDNISNASNKRVEIIASNQLIDSDDRTRGRMLALFRVLLSSRSAFISYYVIKRASFYVTSQLSLTKHSKTLLLPFYVSTFRQIMRMITSLL